MVVGNPHGPPHINYVGSADCEVDDLLAAVVAFAANGDGRVASCGVVCVGYSIVKFLCQCIAFPCHRHIRFYGGIYEDIVLLDARHLTWQMITCAVGCHDLLADFALENRGIDLPSTVNGADKIGRTYLGIQIVAVSYGAGTAMQTNGVHGRDVIVGAFLQTVHEHGLTRVAPSPDAAYIGTLATHAIDGSGEDAILDSSGRILAVTDDAAGVVVAHVKRGGDGTVLNEVCIVGKTHDARCVVTGRTDGARHGEVLDGGTENEVEGCHALLVPSGAGGRAAEVGRQRVAFAEECAAEGAHTVGEFFSQANGRRDSDVTGQLHKLLVEVVTLAHVIRKGVPVFSAADEVGVGLRAFMCFYPVGAAESGREENIALRHGESIAVRSIAAQIHGIVVRVGQGDVLRRRAIHLSQPDGLVLSRAEYGSLKGSVAFVLDDDGVRILHGKAVEVVAAERVEVAFQPGVVKQVGTAVLVPQIAVLVSDVLVVLAVDAIARAVERDVVNGARVVAHDAAHVCVVVRHVARHAAVLHVAVILAADAAHLGRDRHPGVFPPGDDIGTHPAVDDEAFVLSGDTAHQARLVTLHAAGHTQVAHTAPCANSVEQALVVVGGFFYNEVDGVTVAHERALVPLAATAQRKPNKPAQVEVVFEVHVVLVVVFIYAVAGVIVPVFVNVGQLGSRADYNHVGIAVVASIEGRP